MGRVVTQTTWATDGSAQNTVSGAPGMVIQGFVTDKYGFWDGYDQTLENNIGNVVLISSDIPRPYDLSASCSMHPYITHNPTGFHMYFPINRLKAYWDSWGDDPDMEVEMYVRLSGLCQYKNIWTNHVNAVLPVVTGVKDTLAAFDVVDKSWTMQWLNPPTFNWQVDITGTFSIQRSNNHEWVALMFNCNNAVLPVAWDGGAANPSSQYDMHWSIGTSGTAFVTGNTSDFGLSCPSSANLPFES